MLKLKENVIDFDNENSEKIIPKLFSNNFLTMCMTMRGPRMLMPFMAFVQSQNQHIQMQVTWKILQLSQETMPKALI